MPEQPRNFIHSYRGLQPCRAVVSAGGFDILEEARAGSPECYELSEKPGGVLPNPADNAHFLNGDVGADFKRIQAYEGLVRRS